jgi:hypothetical protein
MYKSLLVLIAISLTVGACQTSTKTSPNITSSSSTSTPVEHSSIKYLADAELSSPQRWQIYAVTDQILLLQGYKIVNGEIVFTLFRSENSGRDWVEVYAPPKPKGFQVPDNDLFSGGEFKFSFLDDGSGWLISSWVWDSEGLIGLSADFTNDFGRTWSRLTEITPPANFDLLRASFIDKRHGEIDLVCDDRIAFFTTIDGGITWSETGSYSLYKSLWTGDKQDYLYSINRYIDHNYPDTPMITNYGSDYWRIIYQMDPFQISIQQRYSNGGWQTIRKFP